MLKSKRLTKGLFILYLLLLVWIVLFKLEVPFSNMGTMRSLNWDPYAAPTRLNGQVVYSEMVLNVIIFIPFGIYLNALFKKWPIIVQVLIIFLVSVFFEVIQYSLAMGASDITDVIHNGLGGIIGIVLYRNLSKKMKLKHHRFLNMVAIISTTTVMIGVVTFRMYFL